MELARFRKEEFVYDEKSDDAFLGAGSFGQVFKATIGQQVVALKILNAPQRLSKSDKEMVEKEAAIMSSLNDHHRCIVSLIGVCLEPGCYALVLEYMKNGSIESLFKQPERQAEIAAWPVRIDMGLDVALGMEFLHGHDPPIIHRDLKSSNVLVDDSLRCKISDFGLAKMRGISNLTTGRGRDRRNPAGTLAFIPPERFLQEDKDIAHKGDVYAFAVVLWQLKEMKQPFEKDNHELIRAHVLSGQRPLMTDDDSCPMMLKNLIEECWRIQPEGRPEFTEIVRKMTTIRGSVSRGRVPSSTDVVPDSRMTRPPSPRAASRELVQELPRATLSQSLGTTSGEVPPGVPVQCSEGSGPTTSPTIPRMTLPQSPVVAPPTVRSPQETDQIDHQRRIAVAASPMTNGAVRANVMVAPVVQPSRPPQALHPSETHQSEFDVPKAVLKIVQRHGSVRFSALGYEMGFSRDQVNNATWNHTTAVDKLQGVFDAKSLEVGTYRAAKELLSACKKIANPFHGIVREELIKQPHIPPETLQDLLACLQED